VDAADYTVWRNKLGDDGSTLPNRDSANVGPVSDDDWLSWKINFGNILPPGAGAGGGSFAAIAATGPAETPQALAAAPDAVDLALIDLAANSLGAKAAGADAAFFVRDAAGGSALFDRSLLLAARRIHDASGPEQQEDALDAVANHDGEEAKDVDEVFAVLGEMQTAF
jgi:hypothetical protein